MKPCLPVGLEPAENDSRGSYRLSDQIILGTVETRVLMATNLGRVTSLATSIAERMRPQR